LGPLPEINDDPAVIPFAELINEDCALTDKKYLGMGRASTFVDSGDGRKGCALCSLILPFSRKASNRLKLIFERTDPLFHCLSMAGSPIWIGDPPPPHVTPPPYAVSPLYEGSARVWNTGHKSRNNFSMVLLLPWPNLITSGQPMEVLIDPVANGRNRMWVIAE
jgi:hypothetical protein